MPESWWLKVKRAQKHMVEIKCEIRRYQRLHPYRFERVVEPNPNRPVKWGLRITEQPDPMIALMLGDFVHNLRSALDHVVVASIPKKDRGRDTGFPFASHDIFAKDANGNFVIENDQVRNNFERPIQGIDSKARAIIVALQPFHHGAIAHRHALGVVSRLDNADKHRELTTFTSGLLNVRVVVTTKGVTLSGDTGHPSTITEYLKDGAVVGFKDSLRGNRPVLPHEFPTEVDVNFTGTPAVFIRLARLDGRQRERSSFKVTGAMVDALRDTRRALRLLEPFAVYR
jgi:hypothetical protein